MSEMSSTDFLAGMAARPYSGWTEPSRRAVVGKTGRGKSYQALWHRVLTADEYESKFGKWEIKMNLYLVFEIAETHEPKPGTYYGEPRASDYETRFVPTAVGCFEADTEQAACVEAAKRTRRLGNYAAVAVIPMAIDFTASETKQLNGTADDDN